MKPQHNLDHPLPPPPPRAHAQTFRNGPKFAIKHHNLLWPFAPDAAAAAEHGSLSALHRLIVEGEYMAALRSDPAAALLRIADHGSTPDAYMTAVAERVSALLSGSQIHPVRIRQQPSCLATSIASHIRK